MGFLDFLRSWRRRVSPTAPTATVPEPTHGNVGSGAPSPFDVWTIELLNGHALVVITDDGLFERVGPRVWHGFSVGRTIGADPLEVCEWLEERAGEFWRAEL